MRESEIRELGFGPDRLSLLTAKLQKWVDRGTIPGAQARTFQHHVRRRPSIPQGQEDKATLDPKAGGGLLQPSFHARLLS